MIRLTAVLAFATLLFAGDEEPDPHVLAKGKAPTPFTAEEIRTASPAGRTSLFRVSGAGKAVLVRFRFGESDAESVRLETVQLSEEGKPLARPAVGRTKWRALQAHASFDEKSTTIGEAVAEVPFGKFDCLLYTLKSAKGVQKFYFAKQIPGPPIRMVVEVDGKIQQEMELIEHRCFDYAKVFGAQAAREDDKIPGDWRVDAKVEASAGKGALQLVAGLAGNDLPPGCAVRIESGPLKGAVFHLRAAGEAAAPACRIALPEAFRMRPGPLKVRILTPESS